MAEDSTRPAGENRRHPASTASKLRAPHREDFASHPVQPTIGHSYLDRSPVEAEFRQLPSRHNTMLGRRQLPHSSGRLMPRTPHGVSKASLGPGSPLAELVDLDHAALVGADADGAPVLALGHFDVEAELAAV